MLTVADTDIIKEIMVKQFSNFTDRWVGCVILMLTFYLFHASLCHFCAFCVRIHISS